MKTCYPKISFLYVGSRFVYENSDFIILSNFVFVISMHGIFKIQCVKYTDHNLLFRDLTSPISEPSVGTKLQGLLLDEIDEDFNPRATESNNTSISSALTSTPFSSNGVNSTSPAPLRTYSNIV